MGKGWTFRLGRLALAAGAVAAMAGCTPAPKDGTLIADPYEATNRRIHELNKGLDTGLVEPGSRLYEAVTPTLVTFLVRNGISNLELPVYAANQLLQGRPLDALSTAGRFGLNTVFGAAGLLDPATEFGLPLKRADFGETLFVWGVQEGAYIELPFLGPSSERDAFGVLVDYLMNPTTYFTGFVVESPTTEILLGLRGTDILAFRAENADLIDQLYYESSDSYTEVKNAYVQLRRRELGVETTPEDALPDIFEDPADPQQ
ncbi:MAG: VacJ family lipoprotein [Pseudomonadota bacterium]